MEQALDLYARPSHWKRNVALGLAATLLLGVVGYRWMTSMTPVSPGRALELFHAAKQKSDRDDRPKAGARDRDEAHPSRSSTPRKAHRKDARPSSQPAAVAAPAASDPAPGSSGTAPPAGARTRQGGDPVERRIPPEGVYSWDTDGYEQAAGTRRTMPGESQRIVTHAAGGWDSHHYFSEEREIWTEFRLSDEGAAIAYQRNKVKFGPVTNDSAIDFAPPMLVGPRTLEVGQTWAGSWEGKTRGDYDGRTFERVELTIGGTKVEAYGIRVNIHLEGEQEGDVLAEVWYAPEHGMTVKEHFVQDVKADVGSYHGEWTITLKSLEPQT
jgi:hypothetical protein